MRTSRSSSSGSRAAAVCSKRGEVSSSFAGSPTQSWMPASREPPAAQLRRRALGMHDAAPGGHPVDVARANRLHRAEAVAMQDLAFEEIGHRGKADVRMRPHVEAFARRERHRAHLVKEHERTDRALARCRQRPAHFEAAAEVTRARNEQSVEHVGQNSTMPIHVPLGDVAHVIQLAIAPVFLLTAVGTVLNVLANRLGRTVDRRRALVAALPELDAAEAERARAELGCNDQRARLTYVSISLAVLSALLICLLIAMAFVDAVVSIDLGQLIAMLFVLAMLALIGSLTVFLREIFLGVNTPRCSVR
jgi:uncharacterized protein DUF2721